LKRLGFAFVVLAAGLVLAGAQADTPGAPEAGEDLVIFTPYEVRRILQHSPLPPPPPDPTNRVADSAAAARLGQRLFFEPRLSESGRVSCATCHEPLLGWSNGQPLGQAGGRPTRLHVPTLWNVAYNRWFFWDGRADTAWTQALEPLENPAEIATNRARLARFVAGDPVLRPAYEEVFGPLPSFADAARFPADARPEPFHTESAQHQAWTAMAPADQDAVDRVFTNLGKSLAAFERRLVSRDAPFDRFVAGLRENDPAKLDAISTEAKRGLRLFLGKGNCRTCHSGPNFTNGEFHSLGVPESASFFETGRLRGIAMLRINPLSGAGRYSDDPAASPAPFLPLDSHETVNQVKTPTLRNVAQTAPYLHNGRMRTLNEVLRFYSDRHGAQRVAAQDEALLRPLHLTGREIADLTAFLESLTGAPLDPSLNGPLGKSAP
jgi:cytochrome c peroxidase